MSQKNLMLVLVFLGIAVSGCTTTSVSTDYDKSVDFSKYKSFHWASDQPPAGDSRFDASDLREAIRQSVETELQAKGIRKADAGQPDLLLKYYITVEQKKEVVNGPYAPAFNPRAGVAGPTTYMPQNLTTFHYDEGTFILDMLDPRSGAILWRGTLEGMVDPGATPEKRIERVPGAIASILKKFPPLKN